MTPREALTKVHMLRQVDIAQANHDAQRKEAERYQLELMALEGGTISEDAARRMLWMAQLHDIDRMEMRAASLEDELASQNREDRSGDVMALTEDLRAACRFLKDAVERYRRMVFPTAGSDGG